MIFNSVIFARIVLVNQSAADVTCDNFLVSTLLIRLLSADKNKWIQGDASNFAKNA